MHAIAKNAKRNIRYFGILSQADVVCPDIDNQQPFLCKIDETT